MLETNRLLLRQWKASDYAVFAEMCANKSVMRFFPRTLSETECYKQIDQVRELIDTKGYGFWAVEEKSTQSFIGFVGLHDQAMAIPNAPLMEIGWRLGTQYWGKGFATEAATQALAFAFNELDEPEVYAFTALPNTQSRKVMERLGMINTEEYFNHPKIEDGHDLQAHCLYRLRKTEWLKGN